MLNGKAGGTIELIQTPTKFFPFLSLKFATFSVVPILGPLIAPVAAGFLSDRYGFRPVFWLLLVFSVLLFILFVITLPETYSPVLLRLKAAKRREETGDERYWCRLDREDFSIQNIVTKVLARPLIMYTEPIVALIS